MAVSPTPFASADDSNTGSSNNNNKGEVEIWLEKEVEEAVQFLLHAVTADQRMPYAIDICARRRAAAEVGNETPNPVDADAVNGEAVAEAVDSGAQSDSKQPETSFDPRLSSTAKEFVPRGPPSGSGVGSVRVNGISPVYRPPRGAGRGGRTPIEM